MSLESEFVAAIDELTHAQRRVVRQALMQQMSKQLLEKCVATNSTLRSEEKKMLLEEISTEWPVAGDSIVEGKSLDRWRREVGQHLLTPTDRRKVDKIARKMNLSRAAKLGLGLTAATAAATATAAAAGAAGYAMGQKRASVTPPPSHDKELEQQIRALAIETFEINAANTMSIKNILATMKTTWDARKSEFEAAQRQKNVAHETAREVAQREKKAAISELKAIQKRVRQAQLEKKTATDTLATVQEQNKALEALYDTCQQELKNTQIKLEDTQTSKRALEDRRTRAQANEKAKVEALTQAVQEAKTQAAQLAQNQLQEQAARFNKIMSQMTRATQVETTQAAQQMVEAAQRETAAQQMVEAARRETAQATQAAQQMVEAAQREKAQVVEAAQREKAQAAQQIFEAAQRETAQAAQATQATQAAQQMVEKAQRTLDGQRAQLAEAVQKVEALQQELNKRTEENAMYRTSMEKIGNDFFEAGFIEKIVPVAGFINPYTGGVLGDVSQTLIGLSNATAILKEFLKETKLTNWKDANLTELLDPASGPIPFLIRERNALFNQVNTAKQILYKAVLPLVVPRGTSFPELQTVSLVGVVNELSRQLSELLNRIHEQVRDLAPGESKLTFTSISDGLREWTVLLMRELATLLGQESASKLSPAELTVGSIIKKLLARITEIGNGVGVDGPDDILPEIKAITASISKMITEAQIALQLPNQHLSTILNAIWAEFRSKFNVYGTQLNDSKAQFANCTETNTTLSNRIRELTEQLTNCLTETQFLYEQQRLWKGVSEPFPQERKHTQSVMIPERLNLQVGQTPTASQRYLVDSIQPAVNDLIRALHKKQKTVPNNVALKAITLINEAQNFAQQVARSDQDYAKRLHGLVEQLTKMQTNIFK